MLFRLIGKLLNSMFEIESSFSELKLSKEFSKRVLGWLDNNEDYLKQAYKQVNKSLLEKKDWFNF